MKRKTGVIYSFVLLIEVVVIAALLGGQAQKLAPWRVLKRTPQVTFSTTYARPGEFFVIRVDRLGDKQTITITAPFISEEPRVFANGAGGVAIVPLDYRSTPGSYVLEVVISESGRAIHRLKKDFTVDARDFAIQRMYVSPEVLSSRDDNLWAEDRILISQARSQTVLKPSWEGSFLQPLEGRITTQFGQIRYINDQESGRHSGLDIAAPKGSSIIASNHGVVTLARPLYVTGNTVILDHGINVFTSYSHLDQVNVQVGQQVAKGEIIGTVGNTGFSTGPHLHWAVSVGAVFVDPALVMATELLRVD